MKKKRITIKGKQVAYYESRDNGQAVVLVHGFSSCSSIFIRQLIDSVLSYQYRLIALDLIGHGNADFSDHPEKDYTINGLGEFLVEFSRVLELDEAVYVGHNVGANIIIEAINNLKNPLGLALLSAIPFSNPMSMDMFINKDFLDILFKAGVDDSEVHQMASWFVEKDTAYPDFIPEVIRKADIKTRKIFFDSINNGGYEDQIKRLSNLKIPIASFIGENDQIFDIEHLKSISMPTLWNNDIQTIKNAGHIFFYENPADFNVSFESFLNSVFN